ncbi:MULTISPECIES: ATP-binding protein [Streptomyces]|jgi:hypothetical protein|nr:MULTISPECIES: ATP-binding protein [Streptomyces]MDN5385553.1 ATP-binding protein [Streptomyces sp. LB8]
MTVETAACVPEAAAIVRSFTTQLPGAPRALITARTWTRQMVTILGWPGDVQQAVDVVSRLVDNGVQHGVPSTAPLCERQLTLSVALDESGALLIDVADMDPAFPDFDAAVRGEKGRGLWQVACLGARVTWFLHHAGTGKTVRAALAPSGRPGFSGCSLPQTPSSAISEPCSPTAPQPAEKGSDSTPEGQQ